MRVYLFFAADNMERFFKIGMTKDIVSRLKTYNTGRVYEVDIQFLAIVKNCRLIENCVKSKMRDSMVYKNRELHEIDAKKLKSIITRCYRKCVSKEANEEMYTEISNLLGLYKHLKNHKNHKPYVVIDKTCK